MLMDISLKSFLLQWLCCHCVMMVFEVQLWLIKSHLKHVACFAKYFYIHTRVHGF